MVFADDVVHALSLRLDPEARASLLADPTSYAPATFSDGALSLLVGVRLKGSTSYQPLTAKPNLRVSFDHYVDGQTYDGLEAFDLINEAEDPAAMSEAIAYRIFRSAGQPASRTGFAALTLDDEAYGLYTLVEKKDDGLIHASWPDDEGGSLYESSTEKWPCDLDDGGAPSCDCWEQDEVGEDDTRADLETLCAVATDTPDEGWYAAIGAAVDWQEISRHMAMEMLIDAYDHYAGYMGNVYLYHEPEAARWALIPASMNSAFGSQRYVPGSCGSSGRVPTDFAGGLLARRCWADEACAADLNDTLGWAAEELANSDILPTIDAWEGMLAPYVEADTKFGYSVDDYHTQVRCIADWLAARPQELAPDLPVDCLGEGGKLDVPGWGDLSTNGSCDRVWPDGVAYAVEAVSGARLQLGVAPDGIAAGDEVLLLLAQGTAGDHAGVGTWAFADVESVDTDGVLLDTAPDVVLPADLAAWKLVVQRVPHYEEVVVRSGGTLTAAAWDGHVGGVLAFRVAGTLTIEAGGAVSASGIGYAGGATGGAYNVDGYQGESLEGAGLGGASSGEGYNQTNGAWAANLGGGGCNVGGGGGEFAGGATGADSWDGTATAPQQGVTYGEATLLALLFGSGGGGVVNLGGASGPGGSGGGLLYVDAGAVVADGTDALVAGGADAESLAVGTWTYGGGGGAGGTLWVRADSLALEPGAVVAEGGHGYAAADRPGGDGGEGRIRVDCGTVNGLPCSTHSLAGFTSPAAYVGAP